MKLYSALIKKNKEGKIEDVVLLKDGFSFPAFFLSGLWFLYHKMWKEFLGLILVNITLVSISKIYAHFDLISLEILFAFIVALNANYWLCEHLRKRNYEFVGLVFGTSYSNAKFRFIKNLEVDYKVDPSEFDDSILNPQIGHKKTHLA